MSHLQFSDREVERVLAGQQPYGRPELAEVAYFMARLRTLADFEPPPEMSSGLRAQLDRAETGRPQRSKGRLRVTTPHDAVARPGDLDLVRLDARRQARNARLRWRIVGAAAAVILVGGVVTAGLQAGGDEPEVEADTVDEPREAPPTTAGQTRTDDVEAPAASPGEVPSRPADVPSEPPESQVETDTDVPAPPPTGPRNDARDAPDQSDAPEWAEDFWPPECEWSDWVCACEHYDNAMGGAECWESDHRTSGGPEP